MVKLWVNEWAQSEWVKYLEIGLQNFSLQGGNERMGEREKDAGSKTIFVWTQIYEAINIFFFFSFF